MAIKSVKCPGDPGWYYNSPSDHSEGGGEDGISLLNIQLRELGYNVSRDTDSVYDELTKKAVMQFQHKAGGLTEDGIFGPKTCPKWNEHYARIKSMKQSTDTFFFKCDEVRLEIKRDGQGNIVSMPEGPFAYHLNMQMRDLGFSVSRDTETQYDSLTEAAVMKFQQMMSMTPVDGIFGPKTCAKWSDYYIYKTFPSPNLKKDLDISRIDCTKANLNVGSRGNWVAILQSCLQDLGFYTGKIDGKYGPVTKTAVTKAQQALNSLGHNLKPDGWFGKVTCPIFKQYYLSKKNADKKAAQKKKDDEEARKKRLEEERKRMAKLAKERRERNKKVNELVQAWAGVEGNVSFDGMKFVATSIESSTNIRGVNWQTVELMGDQNYTYKGHTQPMEYDITVPLPWYLYYEIEQYLIQLCSAPKEVLCKEIQSGKYYISYTKSTGKGLMQHVKFHIVRKG